MSRIEERKKKKIRRRGERKKKGSGKKGTNHWNDEKKSAIRKFLERRDYYILRLSNVKRGRKRDAFIGNNIVREICRRERERGGERRPCDGRIFSGPAVGIEWERNRNSKCQRPEGWLEKEGDGLQRRDETALLR